MTNEPHPGPRPQRSTPIPGGDSPAFGSTISGGWGAGAPPTPTEFANGRSAPVAPPPGGPAMFGMPGNYGPGAGMPGGPGMYGMPAMAMPYVATRRKRSFGGLLLVLLIFAGPVIGVGIGIWAFFKARDAVHDVNDLVDSRLSDDDRESLGLGDGVQTLFDAGAAPAVIAAFQDEIGGEATKFTRVAFYPDYAFADAQDPSTPTHLDEYQWRSADVGSPSPQQNDPQLESKLFSAADVNWDTIAALTAAAPSLLQVESGTVSHVIVDRTGSVDPSAVTVRVYVTGPRGSGFLEANALTGEVLATY